MIRAIRGVCVAAALAAAACVEAPESTVHEDAGRRLELLGEALAVRSEEPERAVRLLAEAGRGAALERVRLTTWVTLLEGLNAPEHDWRRLAGERLPADLSTRAMIGRARAVAAEGRVADATALLEAVDADGRVAADLELLEMGSEPGRERAVMRLAVAAPERLRKEAPQDDSRAFESLDDDGRLRRAEAWRTAGWPSRAAAELRRRRFSGDKERRRRVELARSEVESGNPRRAIDAADGLPADDPEAHVLKGEAYRRQGWQRYPRSSARASFTRCLESARRGLDLDGGDPELERRALRLIVECGTEVDRTGEALAAWWRLGVAGWGGEPRSWLGRRLGLAIARGGGESTSLRALASSMPDQERCLGFWSVIGSADRDRELRDLAEAPVADLYGQWSRAITGVAAPSTASLGPEVEVASPPPIVAWLIDRDELALAASEWRRIRARRGSWPGDAVSEASLADRRGRRMDAIRALREGVPELGTVAMDRAPENAIRAYLPLEWHGAFRAAATEFGLEPWLLAAVARQESAFTAHARSPRGARGVMQLIEGTARGHGRALGLGSRPDLEDPEINIRLGARELARLVRRFGAVEPALAAYNAGETRARRWWRSEPDRFRFVELVPIPETYNYIRRVSYLAEAYRLVWADQWGGTT